MSDESVSRIPGFSVLAGRLGDTPVKAGVRRSVFDEGRLQRPTEEERLYGQVPTWQEPEEERLHRQVLTWQEAETGPIPLNPDVDVLQTFARFHVAYNSMEFGPDPLWEETRELPNIAEGLRGLAVVNDARSMVYPSRLQPSPSPAN